MFVFTQKSLNSPLKINPVDFSAQILTALENHLDIGEAFPVIYTMSPHTIELFVGTLIDKLHIQMKEIMKERGEELVQNNDANGLLYLFLKSGLNLPAWMVYEMSKDIIHFSRRTARYITPLRSHRGGLWYCKLYINLNQDETLEEAIE